MPMVTVDGIGRELDEEILPLITQSRNNVFILKLSNKYSSGYHRNCVHRAITPLTRNTSVRRRPSVLVSCFASIFLIPEVQCLSSAQERAAASSVLGSG